MISNLILSVLQSTAAKEVKKYLIEELAPWEYVAFPNLISPDDFDEILEKRLKKPEFQNNNNLTEELNGLFDFIVRTKKPYDYYVKFLNPLQIRYPILICQGLLDQFAQTLYFPCSTLKTSSFKPGKEAKDLAIKKSFVNVQLLFRNLSKSETEQMKEEEKVRLKEEFSKLVTIVSKFRSNNPFRLESARTTSEKNLIKFLIENEPYRKALDIRVNVDNSETTIEEAVKKFVDDCKKKPEVDNYQRLYR